MRWRAVFEYLNRSQVLKLFINKDYEFSDNKVCMLFFIKILFYLSLMK